jgi:hypothetical protein
MLIKRSKEAKVIYRASELIIEGRESCLVSGCYDTSLGIERMHGVGDSGEYTNDAEKGDKKVGEWVLH